MLRVGSTAAARTVRRLGSSSSCNGAFHHHLYYRTASSFRLKFNSPRNHHVLPLRVPEICSSFDYINNYQSLAFYCTTPTTSGDNVTSQCSYENLVEAEVPALSKGLAEAYAAIDLALDSVVKIFTVASSPNYFLPWQNKSQRETMGSGL